MQTQIILVSLPYVNNNFHLGHLSGTFIPAEIYAQYLRSFEKKKVYLLSGLDCYGTSTFITSVQKNIKCRQFVDEKNRSFNNILSTMGVKLRYNYRTDSKEHASFVNQYILKNLSRFETKEFFADYCSTCKTDLSDRLIINENNENKEKLFQRGVDTTKGTYYCWLCRSTVVQSVPRKGLFLKYHFEGPRYEQWVNNLNSKEDSKLVTRGFNRYGLLCTKPVNKLLDSKNSYYVWIEALLSYEDQLKRLKQESPRCTYFFAKDNSYYHNIVYPNLIMTGDSNPLKEGNNCYVRNYCTFKNVKMSNSLDNCLNMENIVHLDPEISRYALAKMDPLTGDSEISVNDIEMHAKMYLKMYANMCHRVRALKNMRICGRLLFPKMGHLLSNKRYGLGSLEKYKQNMRNSKLRESIKVLENFSSEIALNIEHIFTLKSKSIHRNSEGSLKEEITAIYQKLLVLLKMLGPFTPELSRKFHKFLKQPRAIFKLKTARRRVNVSIYNKKRGNTQGKIQTLKPNKSENMLRITRINTVKSVENLKVNMRFNQYDNTIKIWSATKSKL